MRWPKAISLTDTVKLAVGSSLDEGELILFVLEVSFCRNKTESCYRIEFLFDCYLLGEINPGLEADLSKFMEVLHPYYYNYSLFYSSVIKTFWEFDWTLFMNKSLTEVTNVSRASFASDADRFSNLNWFWR